MTNQEAKFILTAYRPGGGDAGDPALGDALAQSRRDPALAAWFAREQAHGAAIAARLREIAPPAGLREAILAGARASGAPARARQNWGLWLGLAAGVAILCAATVAWLGRPSARLARFERFAVNDTVIGGHESHGAPATALEEMLSRPTTHLGGPLPVDFAALRATGCRTLSFGGHDVIEVCFGRGGSMFHLYVLQRADFPRMPGDGSPVVGERTGTGFVSWMDGRNRYVVVGTGGAAAVRGLL